MPHKPGSTTAKLRVVFDASAKTDNGLSLNDLLMVGYLKQNNLFEILVRFRFYLVALNADIRKMYRQIVLDEQDRDFHRILWRSHSDSAEPIRHYRMTRVTYGIASSAFHSIRVLRELARIENNSIVSPVILRDFYVDDLLSGSSSIEEAKALQLKLVNVLEHGGFELRKWLSNSIEVNENVPGRLRETSVDFWLSDDAQSLATLGIMWNPLSDHFKFSINLLPLSSFTKRTLLGDISRIFDPLGWLSPFTVLSKLLLQRCWLRNLGRDEEFPFYVIRKWRNWREGLPLLEKLTIPRCIPLGAISSIQLHVFSDASELVYAASVYARIEHTNGHVHTQLLCAKTRVAPVKTISLPRLELCGALLAARLLNSVTTAFKETHFKIIETYAWTDSTIVLAWISDLPRKWTCFVANRVSQIQEIIPPNCWSHVISGENPADCATRGLLADELINLDLWWNGPNWLNQESSNWPRSKPVPDASTPEQRKQFIAVNTVVKGSDLIDIPRFSSYNRLLRSVAYLLRFVDRMRSKAK